MKTISTLLLVFLGLSVFAQRQIAVQNAGGAVFLVSFKEALDQAEAGATIYLPGGVFDTENYTITKQVRIVGIGHNPSANPNNTYTRIIGNLTLAEGSSNSSLEGLYITGRVTIGTSNDTNPIENITFSRCNFIDQTLYLSDGSLSTKGVILNECILDDIEGGISKPVNDVLFVKCIVKKTVANLMNQPTFRNNIFLYDQGAVTFLNVGNGTFENNIFLCEYSNIENSSLLNNIFMDGFDYNFASKNNNTSNNHIGVSMVDIFKNVPDKTFNYNYDYSLKSTSVGVGAGTDSNDIGIFGTTIPFKVEGTPDVPHIDAATINSATDNQGRLSISIKVSAQGN